MKRMKQISSQVGTTFGAYGVCYDEVEFDMMVIFKF